MNAFSVRQAVLSDLPDLAELFDAYRQFQGRPADRWACLSFLRDRFDNGQSIIFWATRADAALGFAQLYPIFSSTALARAFILNDLFVLESGRRQGVASALLEAVQAYAWSLDAGRLSLNVARSNVSAQKFYEARGWLADDQFHAYHRYPPAS